MGMLDSLGNLGGLGQITKMLDAGNWIKQGVNSVLPKNMHVVGDAAGALFDLKTGNLLGAAQLGMEAMKDLPQATKSQQQQQPQQAGAGTLRGEALPAKPALEPSPPPAAAKPLDLGKLTELFNKLLEMLGKQSAPPTQSAGVFGAALDAGSKAQDAMTKATHGSAAQASGTTTTTTTTHTTTHESGWRGTPVESNTTDSRAGTTGWRGEPRTPAPANSASAAATSAPATSSAPAAATPAASSAPASASTAPSGGETISSMSQLNSMSDSAIRDAVIHGRISPEIAKDQTAMMAIQQRMNSISEMNNLMTNMMRALHDMQMAVVQNIRI